MAEIEWYNPEREKRKAATVAAIANKFAEGADIHLNGGPGSSPDILEFAIQEIGSRARTPAAGVMLVERIRSTIAAKGKATITNTDGDLFTPHGVTQMVFGSPETPIGAAARWAFQKPLIPALRDLGERAREIIPSLPLLGKFPANFAADMIKYASTPLGVVTTPLPFVKGATSLAGMAVRPALAPLVPKVASAALKVPYVGGALRALVPRVGIPTSAEGVPRAAMALQAARIEPAMGLVKALELGRSVERLAPVTQVAVRELIEAGAFSPLNSPNIAARWLAFAKKDIGLPDDAVEVARNLTQAFTEKGTEMQKVMKLSPEWTSLMGRYAGARTPLRKAQERVLAQIEPMPFRTLDIKKTQAARLLQRKGGKAVRASPGYEAVKAYTQEVYMVANRRLHNTLSDFPEVFTRDPELALSKGWSAVEGGMVNDQVKRAWGPLMGGWMEANTYRELVTMRQAIRPTALTKYMRYWKAARTIANPPVHIANMMSNFLMLHAAGIPLRRVDVYTRAAREMLSKGGMWKEAERTGLFGVGGEITAEVRQFLHSSLMAGTKGDLDGGAAELAMDMMLKEVRASSKSLYARASALYQGEENFFKMAMYLFSREKGMDPMKAAANATKWIFDYSDVTPWVQKTRTRLAGIPFLTYTLKAAPRMAEAAASRPHVFAMWKNMLGAWNVTVANELGISLDDLDEYRKLKAEYARNTLPPVIGGALSIFEEVAPLMLLPWLDPKTKLPLVVSVARFSPLGQLINPRSGIGFGPGITAPVETILGRRVYGSELGAPFAPPFPTWPGLAPDWANEQMKRALGGRVTELASSLLPIPPKALMAGSPLTHRIAQVGLTHLGPERGNKEIARLRSYLYPMALPTKQEVPTIGQAVMGALAATPQRLDVNRLKLLNIATRKAALAKRKLGEMSKAVFVRLRMGTALPKSSVSGSSVL